MRGGIIPGLHSVEHAAAFFAAAERYRLAGGPPRCTSRAKHGGNCRALALRGYPYCAIHAPVSVRRERRLRLLRHPKTAAQAARALVREQARLQRIAWKADRWHGGQTVYLGDRDDGFLADVAASGMHPSYWSPATADAARWCWVRLKADRLNMEQFRERVRWNVALDRAAE